MVLFAHRKQIQNTTALFNFVFTGEICICAIVFVFCTFVIIPTHQTQEKMHSAVVQVEDHKHLIISLKSTKPYSYKLLQMKIPQHTTVGGNKHLLIFLKATSSYHSEQIQTQTNTIHIQVTNENTTANYGERQ